MKTHYSIFGEKLLGWIFLAMTLFAITQASAQPCSNPALTLKGGATICEDTTTNILFIINGGVPPWRVIYSINGVPQPEISNITYSPFILETNIPGTYLGIEIYDGDNCPGHITNMNGVVVIVYPLPNPAGVISGNTAVCQGSTNVVYSIDEIPFAIGYEWTVPSGATIISGSNTNTITVDYGVYALSGNVTVAGTNACGTGNTSTIPVTVDPLPLATGAITGDATICAGEQGVVYQVNPVANATGYEWIVPAGAVIASGYNTNSIIVDYSLAAVNGTIRCRATNSCGIGAWSPALTITITNLPGIPSLITGPMSVCPNETWVIYSIPAIATAITYEWQVPTGATIVSGSGTNQIAVNFSSAPSSGNILVRGVNNCGFGPWSSPFPLIINNLPEAAGPINGAASVCTNQTDLIYSVNPIPYASTYEWQIPLGFTVNGPNNTNSINLTSTSTAVSGIIRVRGVNNCGKGVFSANFYVTVFSSPTAFAGNNATICSDETYTLNGSSASNYSSLLWSSSGDGTFSSTTALHPVYTPSAFDLLTGSASLTLTAAGNGNCGSINSTLTLTIIPIATVSAGPDLVTCEGSGTVALSGMGTDFQIAQWTSSGDGTFTNPSSLTAMYLPGVNDIANGSVILTLTVTGSGICATTLSDDLILHISKQPLANAGTNSQICGTSQVALNGVAQNYTSAIWMTSGNGYFLDPSVLNTYYLPSEDDVNSGSVVLTLLVNPISPCANPASDNITITITHNPTIDAGPDIAHCGGAGYLLNGSSASGYSSILWSTSGTGTFDNPGNLHPTYLPSLFDQNTGSVTLSVTAEGIGDCSGLSAHDEMTLYINPNPVVNAGAPVSLCEGSTLTINDATGNYYSSINWATSGSGEFVNNGTLTPTYIPSTGDLNSGSVILTLTAAPLVPCTEPVSSSKILTFLVNPTVFAGIDGMVCDNSPYTISDAFVNNNGAVLWTSNGTGLFTDPSSVNTSYVPGISDINNGSVILTLTAMGSSPCNTPVSDQQVLTIYSSPTCNAGIDGVTCENSTYTITTATASLNSNIQWTTSGTGILTNAGTLSPSYKPSHFDAIMGTVTLTLTVKGTAPCDDPVADMMQLLIMPRAIADAGNNSIACIAVPFTVTTATASNYSLINWTSSGTGLLVNSNSISPTYTPSDADLLSGSVTLTMQVQGISPCSGISEDYMVLTISGSSTANAGPDAQICNGNNYTITGASGTNYTAISWSTSGTGTFTGSNTFTPTYNPSYADYENGSVILSLITTSVSPCSGSVSDEMLLSFADGAVADAGPDAEICFGSDFTITEASAIGATSIYWSSTGSGTLLNPTTLTPTYIPSYSDLTTGTIVLTVTVIGTAPCLSSSTDFMALTISSLPVGLTNIIGPPIVCAGQAGVVYSISPPVQYATSYNWILPTGSTIVAGNNTSTITVDFGITAISGDINVIPVNACGSGSMASLELTINSASGIPGSISGPTDVCQNSTNVQYSVDPVQGVTNYQWTVPTGANIVSGAGTNTILVDFGATAISGNITVNTSSDCGTSLPSSLAIIITSPPAQPVITANGPFAFCEGDNVTLSATPGFNAYLWSNGETTQSIIVSVSGSYTVTVSDNTECMSIPSAPVVVTVIPVPAAPVVTADGPLTFCDGGSVTLSAAPGYVSYLWSTGATTQSIVVTQSGTYSVTVVNETGCTSLPSNPIIVSITETTIPVIVANGPVNFCYGNSVVLSAPAGYAAYLWSNGETTPNITVTVAGNFSVQVIDVTGCISQVSNIINVVVDPPMSSPVITADGPTTMCVGESVTLLAPTGFASYAWSNGEITQNITVNLSGSYYVVVSDANGCSSLASNTINVEVLPFPVINAGIDATTCQGTNYSVTGASASNYSTLYWTTSGTGTFINPGLNNPTYIPSLTDIASGSVILTLTGYGCNEISDFMVLTIQPEATVDAGADGYTCEGSSFNVIGSSASLYGSLSWTTSGTGYFNNSTILNPIYSPSPNDIAAGSVQLTLTAISSSPCNSNISDAMTLFIKHESIADAGTDGTICQGQQYVISDAASFDYSSVIWSTSGSGIFLNGTTLTPVYIPGQTDITAGSVTLTLIASNPPCADVIDSQTLTIIKDATSEAGPDVTICQSCSYTVSGAFVNDAQSFTWTSTGTGVFTNSNTLSPTYQPSSGDIANGSVTLILTAESFSGCGDFSDQAIIYFSQNSQVDFTWNNVCEGQPTSFMVDETLTPPNSISEWLWNFGDGFYSNVMNPTHTFTAPLSYTVTLTATDTLGNHVSTSHIVEIRSTPVALFSIEMPNCSGNETQFVDHSSTENGYITRWVWNYGDGSPADTVFFANNPNVHHTYTEIGVYLVSLNVTNSFGCENTYTSQVTITPAPVANFYFSSSCQSMIVNFQDASYPNGNGNIVSWSWDFGDPGSGIFNNSNLTNPQHIFNTPGTYTVTLYVVNFNNCSDTITKQVNVGIAPPVAFTWEAACVNSPTGFFIDPSVVNINAIANFLWDFGDGGQSTLPNPQHSYGANGMFSVTLSIIDTAGCTNSVTNLVNVSPLPVAYFGFTEPNCFQSEVQFTDLSSSEDGYITTWVWNFGDGDSTTINHPDEPNVPHLYTNAGTYNVTLDVTTSLGCENAVTRQVTVLPNPVADFSFATSCIDLPVNFNDLSQPNGGGQIINRVWDFGDPTSGTNNNSTLANPSHIYNQSGTYLVELYIITSNSCSDTIAKTIVINPAPLVDFSSGNGGCANDTIAFVSSTFININTTLNWLWNFGDGITSIEIDPEHIYANAGTYNVSLTITDISGCVATVTHSVEVVPGPVAMFSYVAPACTGTEVQFTNMSTAQSSVIVSWHWDFGDGNEVTIISPDDPNITHAYENAGIYNVTLTVTNLAGCDASVSFEITVVIKPTSNFSFVTGCQGTPVQFTDLSNDNGGPEVIQWIWNFDDPTSGTSNTSNLQNPVHNFNVAGNYFVNLTITSVAGCQDSITKQVTITEPPAAAFIYSSSCAGQEIVFEPDPAIMNTALIAGYVWDFGDGSATSTQMTPSHTYSIYGTYIVTLTVTGINGCVNTVSQAIYIAAVPVAAFSSNSACIGNETSFKDFSYCPTGEDIVSWSWSFGDPVALFGSDTSNVQNPVYIYHTPGIYNVTLTVTNTSGCLGTVVIAVEIFTPPAASYTYTTNACLNGTVSFRDESSSNLGAIDQWQWEFEPNYYSSDQNPHHTFYHTDTCYNVKLMVTDMRGCNDTTIQEVCIPAGLKVAVEKANTCFTDSTWFAPVIVAPLNDSLIAYEWNFDDPSSGIHNTSRLENPLHYFTSIGTYLVSLKATDVNDCQITVYTDIDISELPAPSFSYVEGTCDSTVYFKDLSNGNGNDINTWIWDFGDGNSDTINHAPGNTSHQYATTGNFNVSLTTVTSTGCSNLFSLSIYKTPCIIADFTQIDTLICERRAHTFEDRSLCGNPIDSWTWNFGDGNSLNYTEYQPTVEHLYESSGIFYVSLIISTTISNVSVSDTLTQAVGVVASPKAAFSPFDFCLNTNTTFKDESNWTQSQVKSWSWDFGDPLSATDTSSSSNPVYKYSIAGQYNPTLTITNEYGCTDTISKAITIHNLPVADFTYSLSCQNNHTFFTDISNSSDTIVDQWWWKFKDSASVIGLAGVQNPDYIFKSTGNYEVELILVNKNGCSDTIAKEITVYPKPTSAFTMTGDYENTQGRVLFTNASIGAEAYEWYFGLGSASFDINPVVDFPKDGLYEIMLVSMNEFDCPDTLKMEYALMFKSLWMPNAFSPNNPNPEVRLFKPIGINLRSYLLEIYDTWGNILWTTTKLDENGSPAKGWNGIFNGNLLPQDTYMWKATAVFKDGSIWNGTNVGENSKIYDKSYGTVNLIR